MPRSRFIKFGVRAIMGVASLLVTMSALFVLERHRTQAEMGAVLSAFFSDRVMPNIQDPNSGRGMQIIVLRDPRLSGIWRGRRFWWFDPLRSFPEASPVTRSSFFWSNAVPTEFRTEMHLPGVD